MKKLFFLCIFTSIGAFGVFSEEDFDNYLPMHVISSPPTFNANEIAIDLVYPPDARSSNIEGRVILELFVDQNGLVQKAIVLREEPQGYGFGDAAIIAFKSITGIPAMANGKRVPARFRYPLSFRLR
ncbi:MAG: TonB family protein [Treponema sp.]|jgi:TonB family protein|nr:TonB family protein [Treponema sp.]